jgi:hypothetical protein
MALFRDLAVNVCRDTAPVGANKPTAGHRNLVPATGLRWCAGVGSRWDDDARSRPLRRIGFQLRSDETGG